MEPCIDWEKATIDSFVEKPRRERVNEMLSIAKHRTKFLDDLDHWNQLDQRYVQKCPSNSSTQAAIWLQSHGAGSKCWVISRDKAIDKCSVDLFVALERIFTRDIPTFLCCLPGKLAYFENEEGRWLLKR